MLKNKAKQKVLLWSVVAAFSLIIILVVCFMVNKKDPSTSKPSTKKTLITGASRMNPQEVWVHKFSSEAELTRKRLEGVEETLDKLLKLNTSKPSEKPMVTDDSFPTTPAGALRQALSQQMEPNSVSQDNQANATLPPPPTAPSMPLPLKDQHSQLQSKALKKISLNLYQSRTNRFLKTTDNTIPAGAFAKVVLLGGVDASTAIQASGDPRPILLRLIDTGTLPRRFKSDLEGCHALAASYGDLSSERVFMRLEKLTCVERKTGEVVEMNVQGYVAGEDGRAGLRGKLVDRAGESLRNAMIGGFMSSVGHFLGQARSPLLFSPATGLAQNKSLSSSDIFKQSASNGASGALEKYADFYIKRAEQMQPVIQVAAGRKADIVFTQGSEFTDSVLRQTMSKAHDQHRLQQAQSLENNSSFSSERGVP